MSARKDFDQLGDLLPEACEVVGSSAEGRGRPAGRGAAGRGTEGRSDGGRVPKRLQSQLARAVGEAWPVVVGPEVAENASPIQLKNGTLVVSTSSSVWADTLQYMSVDLAARLNQRLGEELIQRMVFRNAGWEERTANSSGRAETVRAESSRDGLTPEQEQALAEVQESDLPPALRESAIRAMRAAFARSERNPVR